MASKENNVYSRFSFCGKVTVSKKGPVREARHLR